MLTHSSYTAMFLGAALALVGETLALISLKNLRRLTVYSALAQLGYALAGVGAGGADGMAGAGLHLLYQTVARCVWYSSLRRLAMEQGGYSLAKLTGAGAHRPGQALLLGFSMFAAMGLTPFTALPGKEMVLAALVRDGNIPAALILATAGILATVYTVRVVHAVCFRKAEGTTTEGAFFAGVNAGWLALAGALGLACLFHGPIADAARVLLGGNAEGETVWPLSVLIPYLGAFAVFVVGRFAPKLRGVAALLLAAATLGAVWTQPALPPAQQLFTMLFALGCGVIVVYSIGYIGDHEGADRYFLFLFLMVASLIGLASAGDSASFYACFELMTFSSYLLVVHKRSDESLSAGAKYLIMCVGGANVMQVGLLALAVGGAPGGLASPAGMARGLRSAGRRRGDADGVGRTGGEGGLLPPALMAARSPPGSALVHFRPAFRPADQGRRVRRGHDRCRAGGRAAFKRSIGRRIRSHDPVAAHRHGGGHLHSRRGDGPVPAGHQADARLLHPGADR